jgi:heme/copper-type cytochrome/quinol oxidase subunit 2
MIEEQTDSSHKELRPLGILGIFWLVMGLLVYIAALFVKANEYVSRTQGITTNLAAGSILTLIGIFCLYRGRKKKIPKQNR